MTRSNQKLNISEEVARIIKTYASFEAKASDVRRKLMETTFFDLEDAMFRIDIRRTGKFQLKDLIGYYNSLSFPTTEAECQHILDLHEGRLERLILGDALVWKQRLGKMGQGGALHFKIEESLGELFRTEIELLRTTERQKKEFVNKYGWKIEEVFQQMDQAGNGFISFAQMQSLMKNAMPDYSRLDFSKLLSRFRASVNGFLKKEEFCRGLLPLNYANFSKVKKDFKASGEKACRVRAEEYLTPPHYREKEILNDEANSWGLAEFQPWRRRERPAFTKESNIEADIFLDEMNEHLKSFLKRNLIIDAAELKEADARRESELLAEYGKFKAGKRDCKSGDSRKSASGRNNKKRRDLRVPKYEIGMEKVAGQRATRDFCRNFLY